MCNYWTWNNTLLIFGLTHIFYIHLGMNADPRRHIFWHRLKVDNRNLNVSFNNMFIECQENDTYNSHLISSFKKSIILMFVTWILFEFTGAKPIWLFGCTSELVCVCSPSGFPPSTMDIPHFHTCNISIFRVHQRYAAICHIWHICTISRLHSLYRLYRLIRLFRLYKLYR